MLLRQWFSRWIEKRLDPAGATEMYVSCALAASESPSPLGRSLPFARKQWRPSRKLSIWASLVDLRWAEARAYGGSEAHQIGVVEVNLHHVRRRQKFCCRLYVWVAAGRLSKKTGRPNAWAAHRAPAVRKMSTHVLYAVLPRLSCGGTGEFSRPMLWYVLCPRDADCCGFLPMGGESFTRAKGDSSPIPATFLLCRQGVDMVGTDDGDPDQQGAVWGRRGRFSNEAFGVPTI